MFQDCLGIRSPVVPTIIRLIGRTALRHMNDKNHSIRNGSQLYPMKPDAGKIWKHIPFDELLKALWGKAGRNAINIFRYSGSRLFILIKYRG